MRGKSAYLFPGANAGDPLSNMAMAKVIERMNEQSAKAGRPKWVDPKQKNKEITVHGFRSTFSDWRGDCTEFPREVAEAALAHEVGDKAEQAYRRGDALDRRRRMMDAWAAYCEQKPAADNVLPITTLRYAGT
jgi:integrase